MFKRMCLLALSVVLGACQSGASRSPAAGALPSVRVAMPLPRFVLPQVSGVDVLNKITPKDFQRWQDIAYGADARQTLDIYKPLTALPGNRARPVVIFVHGGAWTSGSKDDYLFLGESMTRAGYVAVVINYRLAPQHVYPDYIQDTALAIQWVYRHIAGYQGNPGQLIVMGHSAGAFNAVEAVDNPRWLQAVAVPIGAIKAVVGIAGPYHYDFRTDDTRVAFAGHATPEQVMPVYHVRADAPPHLLLVAAKDQRVKLHNAQAMQQALQQQGIPVQLHRIAGASHVSVMAAMASRLAWYHSTRQVVVDYLQRTVPPPLKGKAG